MISRHAIPLSVAFLILAADATRAADLAPCQQMPPAQVHSSQGRSAWRAESRLIDEGTRTALRMSRLGSGAIQIDVDSANLEIRKTLEASGDFNLTLRTDDDLLAVVGTGEHLRVSRGGRAVDLATGSLGEGDLDRLQELLAGSSAVRRFRAMRSLLAPSVHCTGLGAAVDIIDMMIGVLKGEAPTPIVATTQAAEPKVFAMDLEDEMELDGRTCYEVWEGEVVAAWTDYEGCVNSFAWYNPLREVCAFAWVIRVESAWFRLIGCSSFPIKTEVSDVEGEGDLH